VNISFSYNSPERAPKLPNSAGKAKSRIHFGDFTSGKDPYAIAAKRIITKGNNPPKLHSFQKKIYILQQDPDPNKAGTYYKINKLSLKKRLGISSEELKNAAASGSVINCIQQKLSASLSAEIRPHLATCHALGYRKIAHYIKELPLHLQNRVIEGLIQEVGSNNHLKLTVLLKHLKANEPPSLPTVRQCLF
jgi:hypothetical protein